MQIVDQMLANLMAVGNVQPQNSRPVQDASPDGDNSFRTLLEQKQNQATAPGAERPGQVESQPEENPSAVVTEPNEGGPDAQMLIAAMMAAQAAPVLPFDATVQPDTADVSIAIIQPQEVAVPSLIAPQDQPILQTAPDLTVQTANAVLPNDVQLAQAAQQPQEVQTTEQPVLRQEVAPQQASLTPSGQQQAQPADITPQGRQDSEQEEILFSGQGEQPLFRNVEAAPVKVGESAEIDTASPTMDSDMASVLDKTLLNGEQRVEIKLSPESLGTVTVEMTRMQDGTLHVALHTTSSRASGLLESHVSALEGLLAGANQVPVHVEVQRQADSQQPQHYPQDGGQQQNPQQQNHQQQNRRQHNEDFLQQLRLGLIPLDAAV